MSSIRGSHNNVLHYSSCEHCLERPLNFRWVFSFITCKANAFLLQRGKIETLFMVTVYFASIGNSSLSWESIKRNYETAEWNNHLCLFPICEQLTLFGIFLHQLECNILWKLKQKQWFLGSCNHTDPLFLQLVLQLSQEEQLKVMYWQLCPRSLTLILELILSHAALWRIWK